MLKLGIKIKKLSELLGNINIVIFTPDDISILKDGPNVRRRFLDMMIGQLRTNYVYNLNMYLKTLEQRNNYLKQQANNGKSYNRICHKCGDWFVFNLFSQYVSAWHHMHNHLNLSMI